MQCLHVYKNYVDQHWLRKCYYIIVCVLQGARSRWQRFARSVLEWSSRAGKLNPGSPSSVDGRPDSLREKLLSTQSSIDVKQMKEVRATQQPF